MWEEVANQWHFFFFFFGRGGGWFISHALLVQRREAANKYGAYLGLYSPPVGAVLEMGIEGLAISRLMRQTKPKLIRAESLRCSIFDLWLIAWEWFNPVRLSAAAILVQNWWFHFTNLPVKGRWCWSLQESGVRACGYWTGLIVQVKYNSRDLTFKGLLSEIYFKARLQFGAH